MTYHRATDPVIVKGELVTFWQYWPDMTMAKVQHADGRFRSYNVTNIHKHPDISEIARKCVDAVREAFGLEATASWEARIRHHGEEIYREMSEHDQLVKALELIASLGGRTLLGPVWDTERQHEIGAAKAFEQAADIAREALAAANPKPGAAQ